VSYVSLADPKSASDLVSNIEAIAKKLRNNLNVGGDSSQVSKRC
jgi:hypothetical protein